MRIIIPTPLWGAGLSQCSAGKGNFLHLAGGGAEGPPPQLRLAAGGRLRLIINFLKWLRLKLGSKMARGVLARNGDLILFMDNSSCRGWSCTQRESPCGLVGFC